MNIQNNPYTDPLRETVERAYKIFGKYEISQNLEVCHCAVCMTEETLLQIVNTPVRQLSTELIIEYSNSAHGVPRNCDDLKAIMPRYLDLIFQDDMVDHTGVGTELLRFGDAIRLNPKWLSANEMQVYIDWAQAMLHNLIWDAALGGDDMIWTAWSIVESAVAGGLPVAQFTRDWMKLCDDPDLSTGALVALWRPLAGRARWKTDGYCYVDFYGLTYTDQLTIDTLYDWLNAPHWQGRISDAVVHGNLDEHCMGLMSQAEQMVGKLNPQATKLARN